MDRKIAKKKIRQMLKSFAQQHGFKNFKTNIIVRVHQDVLHSIVFEFDDVGFRCSLAIQPLYKIANEIHLTFGGRLYQFDNSLKKKWYYEDDEDEEKVACQIRESLEKYGFKWFEEAGSPRGIITFIESGKLYTPPLYLFGVTPMHKSLYLGYSYAYTGNYKKSEMHLVDFLEYLKNDPRPLNSWEKEVKEQIYLLKDAFKHSDSAVKALLAANIAKTKQALKLE